MALYKADILGIMTDKKLSQKKFKRDILLHISEYYGL